MDKIKDIVLMNAYWYMIPILVFNIVFAKKLTDANYLTQPNDIGSLDSIETVLRIAVWILPIFLFIDYGHSNFKTYFILYLIGITIYFATWIFIIYFPELKISKSWWILLGPAYTPLIWLTAVSLLSKQGQWLIVISFVFTIIHTLSTYLKLKPL